ncbi:hypothetical protein CLAFUW4_04216 [Fulvia fulva]|nr:hypothetical protein CLAFUR4_04202 [Fulvia fulva]WPV13629.1 hypothetical protein CLAFUW4_04216 [Fulvia fulva]WPV29036.1 hypothetical protein CLAFUW7_04205 [Fulvia fulva]
MRFFDIDQPFASRAAPTRLTDLDRALADDVEDDVASRTSSIATVKQYAALAVQPIASAIETASISMASSIQRYDHLSSGDSSSISSETLITDCDHKAGVLDNIIVNMTRYGSRWGPGGLRTLSSLGCLGRRSTSSITCEREEFAGCLTFQNSDSPGVGACGTALSGDAVAVSE